MARPKSYVVTPRNVSDIQEADLLLTSYLIVVIFTISPSVLHRPEVTPENLHSSSCNSRTELHAQTFKIIDQ